MQSQLAATAAAHDQAVAEAALLREGADQQQVRSSTVAVRISAICCFASVSRREATAAKGRMTHETKATRLLPSTRASSSSAYI